MNINNRGNPQHCGDLSSWHSPSCSSTDTPLVKQPLSFLVRSTKQMVPTVCVHSASHLQYGALGVNAGSDLGASWLGHICSNSRSKQSVLLTAPAYRTHRTIHSGHPTSQAYSVSRTLAPTSVWKQVQAHDQQ